ncbi:hypothetical protein EVAR_5274_1 [Eumeta japonica]|uniref:Disks large-associated protein 1 n=1 Tax=Eumeta variegata TaxID=151549 RepID=A0A4C1TLW4_EUMVA|nr:hypothetical protein EVAR_5274_1 [Eumeta japonica]
MIQDLLVLRLNRKALKNFEEANNSDLPDKEDKKSPVLLLGVNKIADSPSFVRRRSTECSQGSGSGRFFRPPKSKYTRGLNGDERLEKIRQDLSTHKHRQDQYVPPPERNKPNFDVESRDVCLKLNCAGNCKGCQRYNSSNRGSFSFHRPEDRQSSLCPSEPYGTSEQGPSKDYSESEIEFKYTEHVPSTENFQQPCCSKQNSSYNVTPKSTERRHFLLANLNERFRKTLSLDSRKVETNRLPLSIPKEKRPKSLDANASNVVILPYRSGEGLTAPNTDKINQQKKKKFRPKSFFSLETFFDSKKSDTSSVDDFSSSKYKRFELESDDSPVFRRDWNNSRQNDIRERTPDLLNLPVIIDSVRRKQSDTRRQLEKLENHYYKSLTKKVVDAVPKDATTENQGTNADPNKRHIDDDEVEYIEPIRSNFTSQSTLILDSRNIPHDLHFKPDSILTINTDETDIRFPSSTVSPKSNDVNRLENDLDSIGAFEIEVKESDLLVDQTKELTVKVMDKSIDSIGSCSLDVDASTDFSDTTSGSLNLLTPSSTTSRIRDFTTRFQERAASANVQPNNRHLLAQASLNPSPALTLSSPSRTPVDLPSSVKEELPKDNLLKPPSKVVVGDNHSHRSRSHHKKRDEIPHKKPSYLNLACSVNGYTNLTTYDSKLRQDISKSREASPIRPITHTYQYRSDFSNTLVVPVPVSVNKLLVPNFEPHDTRADLTGKAPIKAHTDPHLASSPLHAYMAAENKQLKNDFLGSTMTTTSNRTYMSNESKTFASSMLHQSKTDEVDHAKEVTFKSSYSETNFLNRRSVTNGQKSESSYMSSESYTIHNSNGISKRVEITKENGEKLTSPMKSFIQQRVERLYGPGALAQGFFNQKRYKTKSQTELDDGNDSKILTEKSLNCPTERHSVHSLHSKRTSEYFKENEDVCSSPNSETDLSLPVLRHLRPEFRAQLPILSPKKTTKTEVSTSKPVQAADIPKTPEKTEVNGTEIVEDKPEMLTNGVSVINLDDSQSSVIIEPTNCETVNGVKEVVKDGHYFLDLEKKETERLMGLAASAEKELENLQGKDISEEVLGLLRAASGKARLLATQKMQQFQGLCYNNINERAGEPFPTTVEDLQGFWDMVCLQVRNVDALYEQIARLKENGWREVTPSPSPSAPAASVNTPRVLRAPRISAPANEKARLAAEKRDADRRAMLEHRRRVAREKQLAARASDVQGVVDVAADGTQEVEIYVCKSPQVAKNAVMGDDQPPRGS